MVTITFSYYARKLKNGLHEVHLYIKQTDPTWTDGPRNERLAMQDAARFVREIVKENDTDNENRLLRRGTPPADAFPIFLFAIGVTWNRDARNAHYTKVCYQRCEMDGRWNPVAALAMEQYEYTFSVLRQREKEELRDLAIRRAKAKAVAEAAK